MDRTVPHTRLRPLFAVAYAVCLAGIVWLSLAPSPPRLPDLFAWDKLQHAGAYAVLTFLGGVAFGHDRRTGWWCSAVIAVAVGAIMEILQGTWTVNRAADWLDLAADAFGAVTVAGVAMLVVARNRHDPE
jgi:VanZ family protein